MYLPILTGHWMQAFLGQEIDFIGTFSMSLGGGDLGSISS